MAVVLVEVGAVHRMMMREVATEGVEDALADF